MRVLQILEPSRRREYADAWTELEDVLGRDSFHKAGVQLASPWLLRFMIS